MTAVSPEITARIPVAGLSEHNGEPVGSIQGEKFID
jgi:hypothetical protein